MRLMLQQPMNHPELLSAELKSVFQDYVQHSDLDTMLIIDPTGLNRTAYQHKVQAVMESIFGRLLEFIRTLDPSTRESIRHMVSEIPTTNDSNTLKIQPTSRKSLQIHPDPEDQSVFIREFFDAPSGVHFLNGSYLISCKPGLKFHPDDQIFFAPDHAPYPVRRPSKTTLAFDTLIPLKDQKVDIQVPRNSGDLHVTGYLTEYKGHLKNMQLEIRDDYFDEIQLPLKSFLFLNGTKMEIQKLLRQKNRVVRMELKAKIFPRAIGGLRKRIKVTRKSNMYTSYQSSIQIKEVGADFALLRVMFPISFRKGRRVGLTKAELVDISLANYDDSHRWSQWEGFFRPEARQSWLSFICSSGLRGQSICLNSVNLRYQESDLAKMNLEKLAGSKSEKREMRSRLIDGLYGYLGFSGDSLPKLRPEIEKRSGWTNPPFVQLNTASITLLNNVLNDGDFTLDKFTDEDWTTLKIAIDHHQSTSGGILNILDHLITVYQIKKNPGYNESECHSSNNERTNQGIPVKLKWLRELYEYFGRGFAF